MDKSVTVLVVEDILSARETIVHLLRALGFTSFLEAENGVAALEKIKEIVPGLIISDWNMPLMNGLALLREIRSNPAHRHIPFLFLTSRTEARDVALASDGGVSGYLIKPLTIKALSETLNTVFESSFERDFDMLKVEIATLCKGKKFDKAEELLSVFERSHPAQATRIRLERVHLLMDIREFSKADKMMNEILCANMLFSKGWETMARLQSRQGRWSEALMAVNKAISISPNNAEYYVLRGAINLKKTDLHAARSDFMTALNFDRKNNQIKQDIWNAYINLDMFDEVQWNFGSVLFSHLTCDTLSNMAAAYIRKGKLARALEIYRTALEREPDNPAILFNAAETYMNRKQYGKARELLTHALANDPGFERARGLMEQIDETLGQKLDDAEKPRDKA